MPTTESEMREGLPFRKAHSTTILESESDVTPTNDRFSYQSSTPELRGYRADARWRGNFERMAQRAAREVEFYAIAGGGIQHRADQIRAEWAHG